MHYVHTDHLGSLNVITNESGTIEQELSYDAWGNRRDPATLQNYTTAPTGLITDRGFTGHEHMEAFKLINMNGRIYDPLLGRFLSADKVVANAASTQDYNRFSYCINNPLSYTDPTGWSFAYGHRIWYPWENSGDSTFPDENGGGSGNGFNNNSVLPQWYINRENHNESKLNESTTWYSSLLDLLNTYSSDANFTATTYNNTSGLNFNAYDNLNGIEIGVFYTFHEGVASSQGDKPQTGEVETRFGFCGQCHNPNSNMYNNPDLVQQRKDAVIVKVWAGLMAGGFASALRTGANLTYASRVENATDLFHNFPRALDQSIIQNGAWAQRIKDGANWYEIQGTINGTEGMFQLGINKAGEVFHRAFIPF